MNIALIGYGKMGRMVEEAAIARGHTIVVKISSTGSVKELGAKSLSQADVCIDFSHPNCILDNIQKVISLGKNLVVGTTGWYEHIDAVKKSVSKSNIGFLYSPNFSIGVHLFLGIVEEAAKLIDSFDEYDVGVFEAHHNQKADSPSGTAKALTDVLLKRMKRKKEIAHDAVQGKISPDVLHVSSVRCGSIPGTHTVFFDSPADTITVSHQARSREGFARGAIIGAEWLQGKKGFYSIEDLISL